MSTESLQQLKFLTESLPSFPGEASEASPGVKIHEMKSGTSIAWDLLSLPEILSPAGLIVRQLYSQSIPTSKENG